jgi:hypothetical protein
MSDLLDVPKKFVNGISGLFGGDPVVAAQRRGRFSHAGRFLGAVLQQGQARSPAPEQVKTLLSPTSLPTEDDLRSAKRKQTSAAMQRKGRASTVLTSQEDALGGGY